MVLGKLTPESSRKISVVQQGALSRAAWFSGSWATSRGHVCESIWSEQDEQLYGKEFVVLWGAI